MLWIQGCKKFFFLFLYIQNVSNISWWIYKSRSSLSKHKKADEIWASMKNVHDGLGVKNMSDLILKEVYGRYETKNLRNE